MPYKPAIASMSLGRAWVHDLEVKLTQASQAGFEGVEIFYEDLEYLAKSYGEVKEATLLKAATFTRELCDRFGLAVVGLQPFLFYEGLIDRKEHQARIEKLIMWFKIVKILGTDLIQVPSNFMQEGITGDLSVIINDMTEIADLGSFEEPPVRFAYENMAWGTHVDTWQKLWEVVTGVNRPNFGCCLDTFQIAGRVWADPANPSGKTSNADEDLRQSLAELVERVDVSKVFYIQVVDAEKLENPLLEGHIYYEANQPARMGWSRNCRLFLYESDKGGYLPVIEVTRVLIQELGYEGWVSMELFSRSMADPHPTVPYVHAQRGIKAWERMAQDFRLL